LVESIETEVVFEFVEKLHCTSTLFEAGGRLGTVRFRRGGGEGGAVELLRFERRVSSAMDRL